MPERAGCTTRCITLALLALLLGAAGCASVQTHPTQDWAWRTPASFEPTAAAAPALFEAQGRRGAAAVYRLNRTYAPAQAIAAYRLELQRQGLAGPADDFAVEAADRPGEWWVVQRWAEGFRRDALIMTTADATWALSLESVGDLKQQKIRHTLRELAEGVSPPLRPGLTSTPDVSLGEVLSSPSSIELGPPDASGQRRIANLRTLAAPSTLVSGHALAEPLMHAMSVENYLDLLIARYQEQNPGLAGAPTNIEVCSELCRVATLNSGAWTYILTATVSGNEARHLLLWRPSWADSLELTAPTTRWVDDFAHRGEDLLEVPAP